LPPPETSPRVFVWWVPWRSFAFCRNTAWCNTASFTGALKTASGKAIWPLSLPSRS